MRKTTTDLVCFGELIWDLLPEGKLAGGAPFNIVNRATSLGLKSELIGSLGSDELGDEFYSLINEIGISTKYIQRHTSLPTSVVRVTFGQDGEPQYEIVHPVAWDDIKIDQSIINLVQSARSFVYSSLALRDERSRASLFQLLPYAKLKICDVNLRAGQYDKHTILRMIEQADILRMNEDELDMISKWSDLKGYDRKEQMSALSEKYNFQFVIATLGGEGAVCFHKGKWYVQPVFKVKVKDTVGAGDAFLASFIYQYLGQKTIPESLKFACAVGAITASKPGGTPVITTAEIQGLLDSSN